MDAQTKWIGVFIIIGIIVLAICLFVTWCVLKTSSNAEIRAEMMREEAVNRRASGGRP